MPPPSEPRSIFISYRRDDAGGEAGRLFDDLTRAFGADTVFMDVAGIQPGTDFRKAIDANVASAGVLLAIVGPTWLTIADANGSRRLEDPNDFVRLEIASALARNIPVIPVLVHAATMPHADALPDDLKDLAYRNAVELTLARWNSDVALLVPALKNYVHTEPSTAAQTVHAAVPVQLPAPESPVIDRVIRSRKPWIYGTGAAAILLIALAIFFFTRPAPPPTTQFQVALPFNATGIYADGVTFPATSGFDANGHAFHPFDKLVAPGTQLMTLKDGTVFLIGPTGANDILQPAQPTGIPLPAGPYSTLAILAAGTHGTQIYQLFTINYQDSSAPHALAFSSWTGVQQPRQQYESTILTQPYAQTASGTPQAGPVGLYLYHLQLDKTKNLKSITTPADPNLSIVAITLLP